MPVQPFFESYKPDRAIPLEGIDRLLELGWYRMHQGIFTCSHVNLGAIYPVHWLRFATASIAVTATHRRIRKKNTEFVYQIEDFNPNAIRVDHQLLHAHYRAFIDFDGANSIQECLLGDDYDGLNVFNTKCISVFYGAKLIAGGYFDIGRNSAASILHFFDPDFKKHSLGKYLILLTVDYLKQCGYAWYYPGYIVEGMPKMNYKLFLGTDVEYYEPEIMQWQKFDFTKINNSGNELIQ